ncbi:hypothetical protein RYX36_015219, partial [Vicia faba]
MFSMTKTQSRDDLNKLESINYGDGQLSKPKLLGPNSTGHSFDEQVKCVEKYTFMSPEEVSGMEKA